jgi:hypothetical protein
MRMQRGRSMERIAGHQALLVAGSLRVATHGLMVGLLRSRSYTIWAAMNTSSDVLLRLGEYLRLS